MSRKKQNDFAEKLVEATPEDASGAPSARRGCRVLQFLKHDRCEVWFLRDGDRQFSGLDEGKDRFDMFAMAAIGIALAGAAVKTALQVDVDIVLGRFILDLLGCELQERRARPNSAEMRRT